MTDKGLPMAQSSDLPRYGSDLAVEVLLDEGIEHIALNPGATIRGLHESIVHSSEHGGISMQLCSHEEIAVGFAHGYAKVTGRPMAVGIHDVVGLQHASMAIFNAWVDKAPIVIIGGTGPMQQAERRPRIDWIHTAYLQGSLVRDYVKWETQVFGVESIESTLRRAVKAATTRPYGPVYVCLDIADQEALVGPEDWMTFGSLTTSTAEPVASPDEIAQVTRWLHEAEAPVVITDHYNADADTAAIQNLVDLCERWAIPVIDTHHRFNMPSQHPLTLTEARKELLASADLILALDVRDLYGALRLRANDLNRGRARRAIPDHARVVSIRTETVPRSSWVPDYYTAESVDHEVPVAGSSFVAGLLEAAKPSDASTIDRRRARLAQLRTDLEASWQASAEAERDATPIATSRLCAELGAIIDTEPDRWVVSNWGFVRQWPHRLWRFEPDGLAHIGTSGGGGLGYGLSASLGAALACKETGRYALDVQGDGDLLYVTSALWTAAAYELPLLIVVHNNRTYYRDAKHQGAISDERGRGHSSVTTGISITGPNVDYCGVARGHGVWAEEAVEDPSRLREALDRAVAHVQETGRPALVDVVSADQ